MLERRDSPPYTDEEGLESTIRESMESVRSCELCRKVYDLLVSCELQLLRREIGLDLPLLVLSGAVLFGQGWGDHAR